MEFRKQEEKCQMKDLGMHPKFDIRAFQFS